MKVVRRSVLVTLLVTSSVVSSITVTALRWRRFAPSTLIEQRAGAHPRLYFTDVNLAALRTSCTSTHSAVWAPVKVWTEEHVDRAPPRELEGDFRRVGELVPYAALSFLVTHDERYLQLAHRYMHAICEQPHWGDDVDIEAAHLLYGLSVGYDWLYPHTLESDRDLFKRKLVLQATRLRRLCGRRHPPLNNHRIVTLSALGTAGLALYGETARAPEWVRYTNRQLERTLRYYGDDGFSGEGASYWSYTTEYLLKYGQLADELVGTQHQQHPWLRSAAETPLQMMLPSDSWSLTNLVLNLDDSPRFFWYGPHYQLFRLAALHRDPSAQQLGKMILDSGITRHHADWLSVIWYDPTVPTVWPGNMASSRHVTNWNVLLSRSGWTGNETLCSFSCSPIGGHHPHEQSLPLYPGNGHAQPDANSFTLFSRGAWLVASPGDVIPKLTAYHSTLTFNGVGQLGEGGRWLAGRDALRAGSRPRFIECEQNELYDYALGDASSAYPRQAGIARFERHFLYLKPDIVVILDTVIPRTSVTTTWRLVTPGRVSLLSDLQGRIARQQARLDVQCLLPDGAKWETAPLPLHSHYAEWDWTELQQLCLEHTSDSPATFLVVMQARSSGAPALQADVTDSVDCISLTLRQESQRGRTVKWRKDRCEGHTTLRLADVQAPFPLHRGPPLRD